METIEVTYENTSPRPAITPESLASALWQVEKLRTGRFTQPQFRELCTEVLTREMEKIPKG